MFTNGYRILKNKIVFKAQWNFNSKHFISVFIVLNYVINYDKTLSTWPNGQ